MNKQVNTAAAVFGLLVAMATPVVQAEIPLTLNMGLGQWFIDGSREVDDTLTPWVGFEWAFNDTWAAEAIYAHDDARLEKIDGRADVTTWQVGMLYYGGSYIGNSNRIRPYAAFGAGEIDVDKGFESSVEKTVNAGLGLRWMFTQRFGARFEARMLYSLDDHNEDTLLSVGLNYYLGKVTPDAAPASLAAADAPSSDEDNDGVMDAKDQCLGTAPGVRVDSVGCPLPVTEVASIKMMVNFGVDSTTVEEKYFADIAELGAFLQRFEDVYVDVEGHTDSTGPESYNQKLSQRRAQAVVELLVNQYGIAPQRLEAKGYGESQPVADNATAQGRAENRRVMATLEMQYED